LVHRSLHLLDRLGPGLHAEGVLNDLPGDTQLFYRSPHKNVLVAPKELDGLAFLFGAQAGPDLDGLGQVLIIDLYGLGILSSLEGARCGGHGRVG
jgi:hypothetical protein